MTNTVIKQDFMDMWITYVTYANGDKWLIRKRTKKALMEWLNAERERCSNE